MDRLTEKIVEETVQAVTKETFKLLPKVFGETFSELDAYFAQSLWERRVRRLRRFLEELDSYITQRQFEAEKISDRLIDIALKETTLLEEDDRPLRQHWVHLLTNASDPKNKDFVDPSFGSVLAELTSRDVLFLDALYKRIIKSQWTLTPYRTFDEEQLRETFSAAGLSENAEFVYPKHTVQAPKSYFRDEAHFDLVIGNAARLGILTPLSTSANLKHAFENRPLPVMYRLTAYGAMFLKSVQP